MSDDYQSDRPDDWQPDERLVRQWARHVAKLRHNVKGLAGEQKPVMHLVLRAEDVSQFLTVSDGDGFVAAGLRVRLLGMDAPEYEQACHDGDGREWPCGKKARWRLFELLSGRELELQVMDVDCYGRLLCICTAGGVDVAEVMVREGLAIRYRSERYRQAEEEARRYRRGMWGGVFEEPAAWRARQRPVRDMRKSAQGREARQKSAKHTWQRQRALVEGRGSRRIASNAVRSWQQLQTAMEELKQMLLKSKQNSLTSRRSHRR